MHSKNYTYFLKRAVIFLAFLLTADFIIGKSLEYYYFKQYNGILYRTTYSINKTKADLLIFGSSRANHHYNPQVFEKNLHVSSYNTGRNGTGIVYYYAILRSVLKRYTPKYIILDIRPDEFLKSSNGYDRLSMLLPYYNSHPELDSLILLRSKFERLKLLSQIYPYNSLLLAIILGNTELYKNRETEIKGYLPFFGEMNPNEPLKIITENNNETIDNDDVNVFREFLYNCISAHVKLYVYVSPVYYPSTVKEPSIAIAKQITQKYNVSFFDHSKDTTFNRKNRFFFDSFHLNHTGADLFSNIVSKEIKRSN